MFELYVLDGLSKTTMIEGWNSLIWTERFNTYGDMQMVIPSTSNTRRLLVPGTWLQFNQSKYAMKIETAVDAEDNDGARLLTVTGYSLERLLDDRPGMPALTDLTTTPQWVLTDVPANIIRTMFSDICVSVPFDAGDAIPFYASGTHFPTGGLSEPIDTITISLDPASLYTQINLIAAQFDLGFRLACDFPNSKVYFEVFTGDDRTSDQLTLPAVIFSDNLGNLSDVSRLKSTASVKTIAYVFATNGSATVYSPNSTETETGFDRRVLIVKADDINLDGADPSLPDVLAQRGQQELAKYNTIYQFDAQISQFGVFQYGRDYNLGDVVEERDSEGNGNDMRVTEQIFVSDDQGERAYPTLSVNLVVVPGTWSAYDPTQVWNDVLSTEVWDDL